MADSDNDAGFDPMGEFVPDGQSDRVTDVTSKSWFERLWDAAIGVLVGLVLVLATIIGLFWNEGRAVQTARSLAEGNSAVIEANSARIDPATEGKLVHVVGDLTASARVSDPDLMVDAAAARLLRLPETYLWKETSHASTQKKFGGGEETVTTYTYERTWSDRAIDSSRFRQPNGHQNPQPRFAKFDTSAADAQLGAFRPRAPALQHLAADQPLRVDQALADRLRPKVGPIQVQDGSLYLGPDAANPRIGDVRVSYKVAPLGPASFIGRQAGTDIAPFQTKAGDTILMASAGSVPARDMFKAAEEENRIVTWILRAVGLLVMWIAWFLIFRPIAVVGDLVPLIGSILSAGASLAALIVTVVLGPLVMALAWFVYRPLIAGLILLVCLGVMFGLRALAQSRRKPPSVRASFIPAGTGRG